jgi:hypothetical protein
MQAQQDPSAAVLNARYVAIRTAEARGFTDRLLQAARDRTPGVRRLAVPMLYRFWLREREKGWELLARIGADVIRFPGYPDPFATETFAEVSLAILNRCRENPDQLQKRENPDQLQKLAAIWGAWVEQLFGSPLARFLGRGLVLRLLAIPVAAVLKRQPPFQPLNFNELGVAFAHRAEFREAWLAGLGCLQHPEQGFGTIAEILRRKELPFDLYLMLLCERTLIYHGVKLDPPSTLALLESLFAESCPWFRQSVLYILFHMFANLPAVEASWLDRYVAIAEEFFVSNSWRMSTSVAQYNFAGHLGWPELIIDQHRPGASPRVVPGLMERAVAVGDQDQIDGLFGAIDSVAFAYGRAPLALRLLEHSLEIAGAELEERVLKSLATVRLQDQPLVDAFLEQHRNLTRLRPRVEGVEPTIHEEDMPTLLDGLTVQLILTSDYFRGKVCDAFRRAAEARSVTQFLVQILEWLRDEFSQLARQ